MVEEVQKHSVHTLVFRSLKRTHDMFLSDQGILPAKDDKSEILRRKCKVADEYGVVKDMPKEGGKKNSQNTDVIKPYNDKQQWQNR